MADLADIAQQIEADHLSIAIRAARKPVPAGVPGVCGGCEEYSPRLVDGRCAPCREPNPPIPRRF